MKTLLIVVALFLFQIAESQTWFQASMEHKFNQSAGLSVSNELGYNFNVQQISLAPSLDYTYFSDGIITHTLFFKCFTITLPLNIMPSEKDFFPYVSLTPAHLSTYPENRQSLGWSVQLGSGFTLTKSAQFFFQYRYFQYTTILQGQLTQFGILYTFGV